MQLIFKFSVEKFLGRVRSFSLGGINNHLQFSSLFIIIVVYIVINSLIHRVVFYIAIISPINLLTALVS